MNLVAKLSLTPGFELTHYRLDEMQIDKDHSMKPEHPILRRTNDLRLSFK